MGTDGKGPSVAVPMAWKILIRIAVLSFVILLATACVTVVPNPFSSPDVERARLQCLVSGGIWIEKADAYSCQSAIPDIPHGERT